MSVDETEKEMFDFWKNGFVFLAAPIKLKIENITDMHQKSIDEIELNWLRE